MDIEAIKAALLFGGSSGGSDFEQLTNRPKINDNLIDKNSTNASLGISKTYTLNNTTIADHIVFDIPVETITDIYNTMVKGAVCILSDTPGNIHRLVSSADTDGDNVYVIVQYDDILVRYVDDGTHTYKERIEVDENLSETSANPVMNKTVTVELSKKQNKLTEGTNITIENNVISSNQATAPNPNKLTFTSGKGTEAYDGSLPKMITLEKLNGATKDFVNSSIATNTAFFKGTFTSVSELPSTGVTNNDYAFIVVYEELEPSTVKQYDRYKYTTESNSWVYEYTLNNSSFTADEWATIQSGLKDTDKTQIATNTSAIADIVANMPASPEDVNAQPKSLIIEADFDGENITITDRRYIEEGTVKYSQLFSDSMTAFNGGTDVVLRMYVGEDIVVDLKCNCYVVGEDGSQLVFEGHNVAAVIIVTMRSDSVNFEMAYNIEPADSIADADDGQLTTAKAQKEYFQKKIDSNNKIPYSNISGTPSLATVATSGAYADLSGKPSLATVATSGSYNDLSNKPSLKAVATSGSYNDLSNKPTIPTVPSNLVLGYSGTTSTASALKIVTCTQAQYDASSKSSDTVYLIKS